MTNEEYAQTQAQLIAFAGLVKDLPLQDFIEAGHRAMDIGPLLDPSLWMKGNRQLTNVIHLASALRKFQAEVERQLEEPTT